MHCTLKNLLTLAPLASLAVLTNAASHKADYGMGVAGLLWPTDRDFVDDSDTTAPCGSSAGVGSRTKFPTSEGSIALVAQDPFYDTKIAISFKEDPTSEDDFEPLISDGLPELHPGHTCFTVPAFTTKAENGMNATLQFSYRAGPSNETYYVCADITFAGADDVSSRIPCFNATTPGTSFPAAAVSSSPSSAEGGATPTQSAADKESGEASLGQKNIRGLSSDAVAAIVVLAAAAGFAL